MRRIALAFSLALLAGCSSGGSSDDSTMSSGASGSGLPAGTLTYWHDAKPIFDAKCAQCHVAGGIAPFATDDFASVQPFTGLIKQETSNKTMPPWPPDDGCNSYLGDRSLSKDMIDTLGKWVDQGANEGDPNDVGAPLDVPPPLKLSRVDKTLQIPEMYTQKTSPDDYHCFVIDWDYDTTKYVTGFGVRPGEPRVVHHVIAYIAKPSDLAKVQQLDDAEPGPGYTCFGGPGVDSAGWLAAWAPGSQGADFAKGTGIEVPVGSKIIVQVHYNDLYTNMPLPDQTSVDLELEDSVDKPATLQPWTNPQWLEQKDTMKIPAMSPDTKHSFAYDATVLTNGAPFTIYSSLLHMHTLGTHALLQILHPNGDKECLLQIDDWNFHWQGGYALAKPVQFQKGDQMYLECHWNNTPPMQPEINGMQAAPHDVYWGEGTTDEMCLGGFYMTQ